MESWQAGVGGSAQAGQCRHWLPPLHSAICLASLPTPFLSLSLSPSSTAKRKRKAGSSFSTPPTSTRPPLLLPTTHHTIPPPSHLCSLLLAQSPSFIRLCPHTKTGAVFLKNIYIYILKSNLKEKLFSLGMSCPSASGSSVPMSVAGSGGTLSSAGAHGSHAREEGWLGWGGGGVGYRQSALLSAPVVASFFSSSSTSGADSNRSRASPPPVPRAPVPFSPCF